MADKKFSIRALLQADVSEFKKNINSAKNENTSFKNSFSEITGALAPFAAIIGGSALAMKTFNGVMTSTGDLADTYEKKQLQLNATIESFYRTIGTGDWSNWFTNMTNAIDASGELFEAMDRLEDLNRSLTVAEQQQATELGNLRAIYTNVLIPIDDRIKANQQAIVIEKELSEKRKQYATDEKNALLENLEKTTKVAKIDIENFATKYDRLDRVIEKGKEYNEIEAQIAATQNIQMQSQTQGGGLVMYEKYGEKIKNLKNDLDALGEKAKEYGVIAAKMGSLSAEQLNQTAQAFIKESQAEGSYNENSRRMQTSLNGLLKTKNDQIAKNLEIQKKLNVEKEKENNFQNLKKQDKNEALTLLKPIDSGQIVNNLQPQLPELSIKVKADTTQATTDIDAFLTKNLDCVNQTYGYMTDLSSAFSELFSVQKNEEIKAANGNKKQIESIEKRYAEKNKKMQLAQAIIGGSVAIINASQTKPFIPMGLIAAASAAALMAVQVSAIQRQTFTSGGIVKAAGYPSSGDYVNILANPNEMILNNGQQSNLFRMLNSGFVDNKQKQKVEFKIRGRNLEGVLQNENKKQYSYR
jgi:hypothetical protein